LKNSAWGLARFGKFNLVGLLGTVLQLGLLHTFTRGLRLPAVGAAALAVEFVILHNFAWHEHFTWRDRQLKGIRQRLLRLARFHASNGFVSLAGNTLLTYVLVTKLNMPVLPSAVAAILGCSLANFLLAERWVYADHGRGTAMRESSLPGVRGRFSEPGSHGRGW
jgi:putative flippase GtrA